MQTNLLKPKSINVEPLGGHRAKVTLEPLTAVYESSTEIQSPHR